MTGPEMERTTALPPEVEKFFSLSKRVSGAKAGEILLIEEECQGYQCSPLEAETRKAVDGLVEWLKKNPGEVTPKILEIILEAIILCEPGVDEYRARYLGAAGDYADIQSPLAFAIKNLLESLTQVLKILEEGDVFPMTKVGNDILIKNVKLYKGAYFSQELYKFILEKGMQTKREEPFLRFLQKEADGVYGKIDLLEKASPESKTWAFRDLSSAVGSTEADVIREVVKRVLPFLSDQNENVRREAQDLLEAMGIRGLPSLKVSFLSSEGEVRRRLFQVIQGIAEKSWSDEAKAAMWLFLSSLPHDTDQEIETRKKSLLGKIEPSEWTLFKIRTQRVPEKPGKLTKIQAETLSSFAEMQWVVSENGDYSIHDETVILIQGPREFKGREVVLCHDSETPEKKVLWKKGTRIEFSADTESFKTPVGIVFTSQIGKSLKITGKK